MTKKVKDSKYWEKFGKKKERRTKESKIHSFRCYSGGSSFALFILLIGMYWLARDMGWIQPQVSNWAIIFIILGLYWFIKSLFRKTC